MRDEADVAAELCIILAIVAVIILKFTNVITLDWIWLLAPIWGLVLLGCVLVAVIVVVGVTKIIINDIKEKRNERN